MATLTYRVKVPSPNSTIVEVIAIYKNRWQHILGPDQNDMERIAEWVKTNKLGRRSSFNIWRLKNPAAVTAFLLYWNNKVITVDD